MTDLNVTKGEWRVYMPAISNGWYEVTSKGDHHVSVATFYGNNSINDAHLIAQAKNMYEMLSELLKNEGCDVFEMSGEIQELLNACKPSEE